MAEYSDNPMPIPGIRLGTAAAGIGKPNRDDLALFELAAGTVCAAAFTRNRFRAAPVQIAERHLTASPAGQRYLLVNSGNANAGTGQGGIDDALACCAAVARQAGAKVEAVLPYSTGVIGEPLPVDRIAAAIPDAVAALDGNGWAAAARAMLTTDTQVKIASEEIAVGGARAVLTGIAKGAGMIRPDMATMLAYIGTDAALDAGLARRALQRAVAESFNRITVDGDTSTNDACTLMATGAGDLRVSAAQGEAFAAFQAALIRVCTRLAQAIVRDGEGATRFVTVRVAGARNEGEAERTAFTVAESPLVKTAIFAGDPNWGRLLAAVGRAGVPDLEVELVGISLNDYPIVANGVRQADYDEAEAARRMQGEELTVHIDLGRGETAVSVWTCDLSYDYVRINADYRT